MPCRAWCNQSIGSKWIKLYEEKECGETFSEFFKHEKVPQRFGFNSTKKKKCKENLELAYRKRLWITYFNTIVLRRCAIYFSFFKFTRKKTKTLPPQIFKRRVKGVHYEFYIWKIVTMNKMREKRHLSDSLAFSPPWLRFMLTKWVRYAKHEWAWKVENVCQNCDIHGEYHKWICILIRLTWEARSPPGLVSLKLSIDLPRAIFSQCQHSVAQTDSLLSKVCKWLLC